jgi:hypothetical protein
VGLALCLQLLLQKPDGFVFGRDQGVWLRLVGWPVGIRSGLVGLEQHKDVIAFALRLQGPPL